MQSNTFGVEVEDGADVVEAVDDGAGVVAGADVDVVEAAVVDGAEVVAGAAVVDGGAPPPPPPRRLSVFRSVPGAVREQSLMLPSKQEGPVMACTMPELNAFLYPTPSLPLSGYTGGLVME